MGFLFTAALLCMRALRACGQHAVSPVAARATGTDEMHQSRTRVLRCSVAAGLLLPPCAAVTSLALQVARRALPAAWAKCVM